MPRAPSLARLGYVVCEFTRARAYETVATPSSPGALISLLRMEGGRSRRQIYWPQYTDGSEVGDTAPSSPTRRAAASDVSQGEVGSGRWEGECTQESRLHGVRGVHGSPDGKALKNR